jgi:hypothetical protein
MQELINDYVLEQICCPACGALYSTELVEKNTVLKLRLKANREFH